MEAENMNDSRNFKGILVGLIFCMFLFSAVGSVSALTSLPCSDSDSQTVYLVNAGDEKNYTSGSGKTFTIVLNGWDSNGTRAYPSINGKSYSWNEGGTYIVDGVYFYLESVDVIYDSQYEAHPEVKIIFDLRNYQLKGAFSYNSSTHNDACVVDKYYKSSLYDVLDPSKEVYSCSGNSSQATCFLAEFFCTGTPYNWEYYYCPNGCKDGACVSSATNIVLGLARPSEIYVGDVINLSINVINTGITAIDTLFDLNVVVSDSSRGENAVIYSGWIKIDKINDTAYVIKNVPLTILSTTTNVKITVDTKNRIPETSELDNELTTIISAQERAAVCTDSDGGKNYYIKGVTDIAPRALGGEAPDYCDSTTGQLVEYYCTSDGSNGGASSVFYSCPNGCKDGACIQGNASCIDSDAENYYNFGYIMEEATQWSKTVDTCVNASVVEERICVNGRGANKYFTCPNGCSNGACVTTTTQTCADTDGNNQFVKGYLNTNTAGWTPNAPDKCGTLVSSGNYEDTASCSGSSCYMIELYCSGISPQRSIANCPTGYSCSDGACVQSTSTTCADTDGGKNYYVKGTLTGKANWQGGPDAVTVSDCCVTDGTTGGVCLSSSNTLNEAYCSNGFLAWDTYKCTNGCKDGACIATTDKFQFISPAGGEQWQIGKNYIIKWNYPSELAGKTIELTISLNTLGHTKTWSIYQSTIGVAYPGPSGGEVNWKIEQPPAGNYLIYINAFDKQSQKVYSGYSNEFAISVPASYCGNGVCDLGESQQSCPQDCVKRCPASIDLAFSKGTYYPGDYMEATVKIYDYNKNLMPNQIFNIYSSRIGSSLTLSTDAAGIYHTTSFVPKDASYAGEWKFTASVNQENCQYISDTDAFTIVIPEKCGDGFCDADEKELTCGRTCTCPTFTTTSSSSGGGIAYATGAMTSSASQTAVAVQETQVTVEQIPACKCNEYCHVRCPQDCTPKCGNGVCDDSACTSAGCPLPENANNCPEDCSQKNYCGSKSSDQNCVCEEGYVKSSFEAACQTKTESTTSMESQKTLESGYRSASWKCHDGIEASEGGATSCKSSATWYKYAEEACSGRCNNGTGKCGINSFSVSNECINTETVKEQVKCVFDDYTSAQKCYSTDGLFTCTGTGTCVVDVYGKKGDVITWKSSCGEGYAYTKLDGENDYAKFNCRTGTCTYYKCVPAYSNLYLSTDKYSYNIGAAITITTNPFEKGQINMDSLKVSVTGPYNDAPQTVVLTRVCETESVCMACKSGGYCPPCEPKDQCIFKGEYYSTKAVGAYEITSLYSGSDLKVYPSQFRVSDYSLLDKYLITKNIDGFTYKDAKVDSGPGTIVVYVVYAATYQKSGNEYAAMVAEFGSRADLEKYLNYAFQSITPTEEKIGGYYVYVLTNGGQKVYVWTYKTFLIAVTENLYVTTSVAQNVMPLEKTATAPTVSGSSGTTSEVTESVPVGGGFFTGMITGMPTASSSPTQKHCGSDSTYSECVCNDGETKESFQPTCTGCSTHYRCKPAEPTELIKAYLDKYPSDIKATGTDCETKNGYCISSQDSCKSGFEETNAACTAQTDKCCVESVGREDFLEIVMKLEGMRVKMDKMERNANSLADYYASTGDDERAAKFRDVASMFANAKDMIDDIIGKIRNNLGNLESIRKDVKSDIQNLRTYISSILERMVL